MKALSIRQPWAWAIVNGYKPVENRSWLTNRRGGILIHASKSCTKSDYESAVADIKMIDPSIAVPPLKELERGGIVGSARITDCVHAHESPWFFGEYGFVLRNAEPCKFRPYKGALGFFDVREEAA